MRWLLLLGLVACAPDLTVRDFAAEDSWTTLRGTQVQLRVGKLDGAGEVAVVLQPKVAETPATAPRGPATAGTSIPIELDGVACEVAILDRHQEDVVADPPQNPRIRKPSAPAKLRTLRSLVVELRCGAHPVPGTDAAARGTRALPGLALGLAALGFGGLCGLVIRRRKNSVGLIVLLGVAAAVAAIGLPVWRFDGTFAFTYALLYCGLAVIGGFGAIIDRPHRWLAGTAGILGACAGATTIAILYPHWSGGGPVLALVAALVIAAIVLVIAALRHD